LVKKISQSLSAFVRLKNPFIKKDELLKCLLNEKSESRYLEWKLTIPIGKSANINTKYRMVKAVISFANTDGGFLVFGVDPDGKWKGFSDEEMIDFDSAKLTELIDSVVTPEIDFNYNELNYKKSRFPIIHIKKSCLMPHITTKEIRETKRGNKGRQRSIILKNALYCRYGAKSDLATPSQYERIISTRTQSLKSELLRRIKEVEIPMIIPKKNVHAKSIKSNFEIGRIRSTKDPNAPAFRFTRNKDDSSAYFIHEELSDNLFEEINNIIHANSLISKKTNEFLLGEKIYYRIYAERYHVAVPDDELKILMNAGVKQFYAPFFHWITCLPPKTVANILRKMIKEPKHPSVGHLLRIAILLGQDTCEWMFDVWNRENYAQAPYFYYRFKKIHDKIRDKDRRLVALDLNIGNVISVNNKSYEIGELLEKPQIADKLLSESSLQVFNNQKVRDECRKLDIIAYGKEILNKSQELGKELMQDFN